MTGGINYLERLLSSMQQHGIQSIIDLHAVPSGGTDWDACKPALAGTLRAVSLLCVQMQGYGRILQILFGAVATPLRRARPVQTTPCV